MTDARLVRCDACGNAFVPISVRSCPSPDVKRRCKILNAASKPNVCVWCCKKCNYSRKDKYISAFSCVYT